MLNKSQQQDVLEYLNQHLLKIPNIRAAIVSADASLHGDPWGRLGFDESIQILKEFKDNVGDIYLETDTGYVSDSEPQGHEEDGEWIDPSPYLEIPSKNWIRLIVGPEIAPYV